nr:SsgA family sporulation/cell division regulator [Glycomyces xiaoerkulensis]
MARSATVDIGTTMRLVAPDFATVSVRASLRYDPDDPYAVGVMFHPDGSDADQVAWSFSRELLAKGLEEPTGIGDVRVWPWTTPRGESIALALSSPDGNALFEVNRAVVQRFLRRAYSLVPRGRESGHVDLDTALTKLLAGGVLITGSGRRDGAAGPPFPFARTAAARRSAWLSRLPRWSEPPVP